MENIESIIQNHFKNQPELDFDVKINHFLKRTFDIVGSSIGIVVSSPIIGALALATWYDSGLPMFFKQKRLGYRGEIITVRKIRTMHNGSEEKTINGEIFSETKYGDISYNSDAFTRFGRVFDYTHLNELPQLWNVLKGEMSIVGNRPVQFYIAKSLSYEQGFIERFNSKPGLFGYTQLTSRGEKNTEQLLSLEKKYSKNYNSSRCFIEDMKIIYQTLHMYITKIFNKSNYESVTKNKVVA
ncbi:MAG: sugar transferase [Candidatus Woesearchaeota archaeon]